MSIRTTCAYCGTGCGVVVTPGSDTFTVDGDTTHLANFGRLCSKGSALGETLGTEGRLLAPRIRDRSASWDEALDLVANKFSAAIKEHGPDSVAFYVSGQLLTEDYYVANKLIKGFMGSANIDTNSRLCMASSVAGHKRAFGTDTVPGTYEDLEEADVVVLVGSNMAWCHPVIYQRLAAAKAARPNMKVINIDPRRTATSGLADLHLQLAPGSDVALFNHLLRNIVEFGAVDGAFVENHVEGLLDAIDAASNNDVSVTGLGEADLATFVKWWIGSEKVVTVYSQGVNQSSSGADKVNSIINCHLATGRIGKPGMGPLSVTGQPNAMGGREVGGLANMLACHLDLENADHRTAVKGFWEAPAMPESAGLKAVDMFNAVESGQIKALWVMCTNPAQSLPEADRVRQAIKDCDFVVTSDMFATTDTARVSDVVLPATGWGEKFGTVTNSDRVISRQRALRAAPGEAKHDWEIMCDVAKRMGFGKAFDYTHPVEIFREHAALSGIASGFHKDFDISALADLSEADYDALEPVRWPVTATRVGGRFFGDGQFFTPSGKGKMLPVRHRAPVDAVTGDLPFVLNTGRVRDHWHTMTRTGQTSRLTQHMGEPYLEVHPEDALQLGLKAAALAEVKNANGTAILRVMVTDRVKKGSVFAPIHWTEDTAPAGRVNALVTGHVDAVSGQPESKAVPVSVAEFKAGWYGFAVAVEEMHPKAAYWAKARVSKGWQVELAGKVAPKDWQAYAEEVFGITDAEVLVMRGAEAASARVAFMRDDVVVAALFAASSPVEVARKFAGDALGSDVPILAGRPSSDQPDPGATLCACYNVGINTILRAIHDQSLVTVDAIGDALDAGTNCGSCRPEIAALLNQTNLKTAAE